MIKVPDIIILKAFRLFTGLLFPLIVSVSCFRSSEAGLKDKVTEQSAISYAERLLIERMDPCSQVTVLNPWQGASNIVQKWYLVPRGVNIPDGIDTAYVIRVPVRRIICMSTTHAAMISALDEGSSLCGFSGTGYLFSDELKKGVANGSIREIGYEDNLNKELILQLKPDLVMIYGVGSESSGYIGKLNELGVKVFFNADHLEPEPLGKAEWIRLFGALYGKEEVADSIFRRVEQRYNDIRTLILEKTGDRPDVLLGLPFKDTWYISPGNSYISRLIEDAGGNYLWKESRSPFALPTSLENVYVKALNAGYWLNIGSAGSRADIISLDPRLADLASFKAGNLFNNNKRTGIGGGNDYWESGSVNPDVVLRDIAAILHPELFPGSDLFFYKKLN